MMSDTAPVRAVTRGSRRHFWAEADVSPREGEGLRRVWTDPAGWQRWDLGLRQARLLDPQFAVGARGELVDLGGRTSPFTVTELAPDRSLVRVVVRLPAARLVLTRRFADGPDRVRHEVAFTGPLAPAFALILGGGFRRKVGPSLDAALALAGG